MSSIHNDLATWAGRARALGFDTIRIGLKTAEAASDMIVEQANEIADLEARVKQLEEALRWVRANYASGSTKEINERIDALLNGDSNERA